MTRSLFVKGVSLQLDGVSLIDSEVQHLRRLSSENKFQNLEAKKSALL